MQIERIHETLTEITEALDAGHPERSLALACRLKADMLGGSPIDPVLYGWARFYELKSLYALERWAEAFELLEAKEPVPYAMPATNVGWLHSVGSELAMRLGRIDDVLVYGRRCLEIRRAAADLVAMAQCASTVCHLLGELGRPELAKDFAFELIAIWKRTRAERTLLSGTRRLLDALKPHHDAEIEGLLAALVDDLRGLHADRWSGEARELSDAITNAEWYIGALPPERRASLEREQELAEACRRGDVARVRAMLDAGADPDARDAFDRTPAVHAAFAGRLEVVRLLLDRGAGIDAENVQRRTALVLAADQGHTEVVELLLARGADPDHAGIHDQTALHVAGWQGHDGVVSALLAAGANPELHDATGNTPLTLAATEDVPDVVSAMVTGGAPVDGATPAGHTALMKAAMEGRARVVEVLLALGADPRLRDRHGMTAADWARQEGFFDLGSVLARAVRAAPSIS